MISIGPLAPLFDYSRTSGGWREHSNNLEKLLIGDDAVGNKGGINIVSSKTLLSENLIL